MKPGDCNGFGFRFLIMEELTGDLPPCSADGLDGIPGIVLGIMKAATCTPCRQTELQLTRAVTLLRTAYLMHIFN
jgi:hypothetical protein